MFEKAHSAVTAIVLWIFFLTNQKQITCMMITHNMQSALELGNRTFMMNSGHIIFDTANEERSKLTVNDLLERFKEGVGKQLDNDRMLLS